MARSGPGPAGHATRPWYLGPLPAWGAACAFALALALSTLPRAPQQPSSTESETQITSFTFAPIVVSTDVLRTLAEADPVAVLANATAVDARSLAVLPFAGSSNANPAENATGIAESIYQQVVSQLRAVPGLYLIDAATAAFYSSSELSPQEMALQLGVRGIVEGRVDAVNGDIRFELRFTDAAIDGTSISEAIERPSEELALLQSDIASSVLGALTRPRQAFESDQTL